MASVAGRKKSIVSTAGLSIEAGNTLLNKAASQSTSLYQQCQSLRARLLRIHGFSHYFALAQGQSADDARTSTDPVTQLWDLLSLGISLCYLFDQLPDDRGFKRIANSSFNDDKYEANPDREKKHAIALFAIQVKTANVAQSIPGCEPFTVTDLWDRKSTDGLVKVINTVTAIVDHLPDSAFEEAPPSPPSLSAHDSSDSLHELPPLPPPANARESRRIHITREIIETERKYVEGLEVMQKYATQLAQQSIIDQDTIHLLFPNLNNLLNFQRKFLIRLESTLEQPWSDQRWGQNFIDCEEDFSVYEPYCSNFTNATELMVTHEQNLAAMNHFIGVSELRAFHITPIQRVCKYPLFFGDLIKVATGDDTYQHLDELKKGSEAAHRITAKINEAHRRADNEQIVKSLAKRITDWKGHHLENFGELLLEDVFVVTKSDIDREYHVFLFEKIILCCKEALQQPPTARGGKGGKNGSILKKTVPSTPVGGSLAGRDNPLLLKGRIFLGNVTQAVPVASRASTASGIPSFFPLQVWWKGDDDLEFFTLRCKREDQMKQWEATINRLIKEAAQRRASERPNGIAKIAQSYTGGIVRVGDAAPSSSSLSSSGISSATTTANSMQGQGQGYFSSAPSSMYSSATRSSRSTTPYYSNTSTSNNTSESGVPTPGPRGYPPHNGFDAEGDEDDLEDYPVTSATSQSYSASQSYPQSASHSQAYSQSASHSHSHGQGQAHYSSMSGRGTPVGARRPNALSMPLESRDRDRERDRDRDRDGGGGGYDRPRAQTESGDGPTIAQWRSNLPGPPSASSPSGLGGERGIGGIGERGERGAAHRPITPRMNSNMSVASYASDGSFGNGLPSAPKTATAGGSMREGSMSMREGGGRPGLRSQFSSTRLKAGYDQGVPMPGSDYSQHSSQQQHSHQSQQYPSQSHHSQQQQQAHQSYRPDGRATTPTTGLPVNPIVNRSRSASQPSAYVPKPMPPVPPPLPTNNSAGGGAGSHWSTVSQPRGIPGVSGVNGINGNGVNGSNGMNGNGSNGGGVRRNSNKRGSGSSQSTGDSSDYSPNSSSPITPFGSSESSLGGVGIAGSGSGPYGHASNGYHSHHSGQHQGGVGAGGAGAGHDPLVKVKVHFHEDIFVIQVGKLTEFGELVEKVGRKIRLCGPRRDDGPLRVKYRDEDGDMVSLGSTEDVQMAFEQWRPGGQVTLFVT